ncbi:hypothetical protein LOZ53_000397 [Ophidiomyces ophidiicola]|nr:hypothetical protein LOZ55_002185 [Ophidiomyces ophidiicola]KAI1993509.1 hypothetical protein LOZ51_003888 [Ophidiomyces ophidiicola]KAI1997579.1 hypothetical protein LOZ53_000397 [Ophidiomyces ophidiicola]
MTKRRSSKEEPIPEVYQDMLAEADSAASNPQDTHRATKRRKMSLKTAAVREATPKFPSKPIEETSTKPLQTVYDLDATEESDAEEWEDVIPLAVSSADNSLSTNSQHNESLQITLEAPGAKNKQKAVSRRKPVSGLEKKWRLDIHKTHLLCLLSHVQLRNSWCNDDKVQRNLKRILSKHTVQCLNPSEDLPQFSRSTTFADGLKQAADTFHRRFKITASGMRRSYWLENLDETSITLPVSTDIVLSKSDFRKQATNLQGSRDLGAQFFCAMLRGANVDARLVCSLQPLPFSGVARSELPTKNSGQCMVIVDENTKPSNQSDNVGDSNSLSAKLTATQRLRRFGHSRFSPGPSKAPKPKVASGVYSSAICESSFPVFWVEAFNEAMQKWVVVDPLVTNTIAKPSRFEPPASDRYNNMSYVIAFEEDGSARDVTKRYTKFYNSKTSRTRVECTKDGESWWESTMQFFENPFLADRDQLEIGELTAKAAAEGMPRNVQDFKNHPIYALEKHLRRNEVIHPKREIGKAGLSKLSTSSRTRPLESVYRRSDVHIVKSADGWYRQGRCVKSGEQPLKRVPNSKKKINIEIDDDDLEASQEIPLYAAFQTDLYRAPPVVNNCVPKNVYGNIDVYVPSMVPDGAFHLKHDDAARAAKILDIDYADAVTGFHFRGRHGTAILHGIVASLEYHDALLAIIESLEDERVQAEQDRRTAAALLMWRQLLLKLRIAERVQSYAFEDENESSGATAATESIYSNVKESGCWVLCNDTGQTQALPDKPNETSNLSNISTAQSQIKNPGESSNDTLATYSHTSVTPNSASQGRYTLVLIPKPNTSGTPAIPGPPSGIYTTPSPPARSASPGEISAGHTHSLCHSVNRLSLPNKSHTDSRRSVSVDEIPGLPDLVHNDSDSEIDDQNSMISHDPEDDDAEPEWLLSD